MEQLIKKELEKYKINKVDFENKYDLSFYSGNQVKLFFKNYHIIEKLYQIFFSRIGKEYAIPLEDIKKQCFQSKKINQSFQLLLISLKNVNILFEYKSSILFFISTEYIDVFKQKGGFLYHTDVTGRNALFYALQDKDIKKSKYLLTKGLKTSRLDIDYNSKSDKVFVEFLIENDLINIDNFKINFNLLSKHTLPMNIETLYEKGFTLNNTIPHYNKNTFEQNFIYYMNHGGDFEKLTDKDSSSLKYLSDKSFNLLLSQVALTENDRKSLIQYLACGTDVNYNPKKIYNQLLSVINTKPAVEFIDVNKVRDVLKIKLLLLNNNLLDLNKVELYIRNKTAINFKKGDLYLSPNQYHNLLVTDKKKLVLNNTDLSKLPLSQLKSIIKSGADLKINDSNNKNANLLFNAVLGNNVGMVKFLISEGFNTLEIKKDFSYDNKRINKKDINNGKLRSFSLCDLEMCMLLNNNNLLLLDPMVHPIEIEESKKEVVEYLIKEGLLSKSNVNHTIDEFVDFQSEGLLKYTELTEDHVNDFTDLKNHNVLLYASEIKDIEFLFRKSINIEQDVTIYSERVRIMLGIHFANLIKNESEILKKEMENVSSVKVKNKRL